MTSVAAAQGRTGAASTSWHGAREREIADQQRSREDRALWAEDPLSEVKPGDVVFRLRRPTGYTFTVVTGEVRNFKGDVVTKGSLKHYKFAQHPGLLFGEYVAHTPEDAAVLRKHMEDNPGLGIFELADVKAQRSAEEGLADAERATRDPEYAKALVAALKKAGGAALSLLGGEGFDLKPIKEGGGKPSKE